ncbi:MAG: zf-HC2 domain-containing protein [Chloroflexi bacterium]|nr:zf-HC2 domain-containing protein [Chloroflexota bacterium]
MFTCHAVRARLTPYLHGTLPLKVRRRVSAHLERCPHCHAAYVQQRQLMHELQRRLPPLGQPTQPQLARVWDGVQAEVRASQDKSPAVRMLRYRASYGLAALGLVALLLLPVVTQHDSASASAPLHTRPAAVAFATDWPPQPLTLYRTAASFRSRYGYNGTATPQAQAALTPAPAHRP